MKKWLVIVCICGVYNMVAQGWPKFNIGVRGGYGIASVTDLSGAEIKPSIHASLYLQINTKEPVSIVINPGYESKGFATELNIRDEFGYLVGTTKLTTHINYVVIPVNAKVFLVSKRWLFLQAGFYAAFKNSVIEYLEYNQSSRNVNDAFESYDVGVNFGWGGSIPLSKKWAIEVEARGYHGLKSLAGSQNINYKPRNWNVLFMVGLLYGFGEF